MKNSEILKEYRDILSGLEREGNLRTIPDPAEAAYDLGSNDYMNLRMLTPVLRAEFNEADPDVAFSSSASRLLCRDQEPYMLLETVLAGLYGGSALLFNSGWHANTGIIPALALPGTLILADRLVHASMIDGIRLSGRDFKRFPHNDVAAVRKMLEENAPSYRRIILLTEGIFSMDGDMAPVKEYVALKYEFPNLMLYVDEAHSFGVRGHAGLGVCEEAGVIPDVDVIVGTLGKAACSEGAFCVTNPVIKQYLVNKCRSLIFSTAIAPANVVWSLKTVTWLVRMEKERSRLREISTCFRARLREAGFRVPDGDTPIVPVIVGDPRVAMRISRNLADRSVLTLPIRYPSVPRGTDRLRLALNPDINDIDIDFIVDAFKKSK